MKTFIKILGLASALGLALVVGQARAQDPQAAQNAPPPEDAQAPQASVGDNSDDSSVSFQTFYNSLANQGAWVQTKDYGYVFQPTESDLNWRPYTYGHWVNTDQGMTWVSDESFGWATYHYGRWVNLDGYGWVWVPGYTWAPAWVSWRQGDDDVGWAPLPPDSEEGIDYYNDDDYFTDADWDWGFHIGDDCDVAYGIGPWWYNFCPIAFIGDRDCWRHFHDRGDNFGLVGHTRNVTNINFRRDGGGRFGHVRADGPSVAALNARARTPLERTQLTSASSLSGAGLHGRSLAVYAPRVDPATMRTARPESVGRTLGATSVNRGTDVNRPLAVNSQVRGAAATAEQIHAATVAQQSLPASARVATANTHISRSLTQPLSSLRAGTRSSAFHSGIVSNAGTSRSGGFSNPAATMAPRATRSSSAESAFTGEPGSAFHASNFAHTSTPAFRSQPGFESGDAAFTPQRSFSSAPVYHTSQSVFHSSEPAFRSFSAPQQSFRSFAPAPQPHFSGGGFSGGGFRGGGAPAAHFSGGGGGGGHFGGGGGGGHAGGGGHR